MENLDIVHAKDTEAYQKRMETARQNLKAEFKKERKEKNLLMQELKQGGPFSQDYRDIFADKKLLSSINNESDKLDQAQSAFLATVAEYKNALSYYREYENLLRLKQIIDGTSPKLSTLLQRLGANKANVMMELLEGKYKNYDFNSIWKEYTSLRKALREHAKDKDRFDAQFSLNADQPKSASTERKSNPEKSASKNKTVPANVKIGDVVPFGRYPQNSDGKDTTPIQWQVLAVQGRRALLISRHALACKEYNESYSDVTWETCTLRKWLNNEFLQSAFTKEEQNVVIKANVTADKNPDYSTNPGNATADKVFLLSIPEAEKYFSSDAARRCAPTAYAKAHGAYINKNYKPASGEAACWWWLRSPGYCQFHAALVHDVGSVFSYGFSVNFELECVRPALWINLDSRIFQSEIIHSAPKAQSSFPSGEGVTRQRDGWGLFRRKADAKKLKFIKGRRHLQPYFR